MRAAIKPAVTPRYLSKLVSLDASGDLPREFLLFREGENASTKGSVWFDDVSVEAVMADAETYANDFAIDLDHRMVSPRIVDPTNSDSDAMGWHRLAIRGGDLWAVDVSWTPEGERRLRARSQRYTSPAFYVERLEDGRERVIRYTNVAICARPATYDTPPLVATDAPTLDVRTPSGYGADCMPTENTTEALEAPPPAVDPAPSEAVEAEAVEAVGELQPTDEDGEIIQALAALSGVPDLRTALRCLRVRVLAATGSPDLRSAVDFMSGILRERTERETAERRELITDLVRLNAETPATAWKNGAPVSRLASEPLADLRARVAALRASAPPVAPGAATPPANGDHMLTDFERRDAAAIKDPKARERFITSRIERKQKNPHV